MAKKAYSQIAMQAPVTDAKDVTTKEYVDGVETALNGAIGDLETALTGDIGDLETAINGSLGTLQSYVDQKFGMKIKDAVRVVALDAQDVDGTYAAGVITASANGALTVDGITLALADRILVANTGTVADGIYTQTTVGDAETPWELTRATDLDAQEDVIYNFIVPVMEGTISHDKRYQLVNDGEIVFGTTVLEFAESTYSPPTTKVTDTIEGDDTTVNFDVNHPFGTKDVKVVVYDATTDDEISVDVDTSTTTKITLQFGIAPATGENFRVIIFG